MEITIREFKHADVVTVSGRVDSSTAPKLDQTLKGLMDDKHYNIVLDLSGVEYMSSAGLRAMISCLRRVKKGPRTGDLRLANPSKRVAEVLELAGLDEVIGVFDDLVGAVGSF